jgi:hypothetical protein
VCGGKEMIIVSKRRDELVNFDRIESIWICADEEGRFTIEATADTNSTLGTYSTEERAKEVLQEITEKICESSNIKMDIEGINCEVSKQIYYMPER